MHALAAAGAGFLLAVLWFDLMFDVQARRKDSVLPANVLASIAAYYRRVTTEARPMNALIPLVMAITLAALVAEIVTQKGAAWAGWASLALALSAIGLATARTVRNARRLGGSRDTPEDQTRLARSIYRDHQYCFIAMLAVAALQAANMSL